MMKKRVNYIFYIFIFFFFVTGCRNEDVLPEEKMVDVLHDIQLAGILIQSRPTSFKSIASKDALVESVLKKHGITQSQFDSSLAWYSDNIDSYLKVNDSVMAMIRRDLEGNNTEMLIRSSRRKNINSNVLPDFSYLSNAEPTLAFEIDSLNIRRFPDFEITLNALMIDDVDADFTVSFVYADTTFVERHNIKSDGLYTITKPERAKPLKSIYGNVHLNIDSIQKGQKVLLYDIDLRDVIEKEIPKPVEKDSTIVE